MKPSLFRYAAALLIISSLSGCWKKSGEAIVIEKEHIAAAEPRPSPNEQSPDPSPSPTASPGADDEVQTARTLGPNEIDVDGYVMDKGARGTSKDPRAATEEQWRVRVQLVSGGRILDVRSDQAHFEKLKPGDRVEVTYREGKYTGTIWSSKIE